jgi:hypothetical protein
VLPFLRRIGLSIAVAVPGIARLGDHVDVGIDAALPRVGIADLRHRGRSIPGPPIRHDHYNITAALVTFANIGNCLEINDNKDNCRLLWHELFC